ncbi:ComEA family DNA-binding protein [Caloramator sp. CAR-1]|uniref:ComEA family DNA-binding protein n=1 Tax=Caloramator sp. CAR-1 TaxID=3062777 RepID=UPI0026E30958|nr:ComEA family DNA-binding protein [Caloramator sp. CAR-1]MDO6355361.1 ComEA family DNA-binding protein [Caloramator sp. CAR-1]
MDLTRREKIGLAVFLFIILFITSFYYYKDKRKNEMMVIKTSRLQEEQNENDIKEIKVYICGEVKKPGVYTLIEGERLYKLIDIAGGFTDKAAKENLNLAMKLKDEDYIFVPSIEGLLNNSQGKTISSKININTATLEELKTLPRVGDAIAQRIIEYREKNGPFRDIKDIKNVSGIGDKMFENIKDKITVR